MKDAISFSDNRAFFFKYQVGYMYLRYFMWNFAGRQNGYGNVVEVEHGNGKSTLYAHLSRIDVRQGQRIDQGVRVGAVGATGWATGPHLHFEFKVHGEQVHPLAIAKSSEAIELSPAERQRFAGVAQQIRGQLDAALTVGATVAE